LDFCERFARRAKSVINLGSSGAAELRNETSSRVVFSRQRTSNFGPSVKLFPDGFGFEVLFEVDFVGFFVREMHVPDGPEKL
jgi:hypothetical protein